MFCIMGAYGLNCADSRAGGVQHHQKELDSLFRPKHADPTNTRAVSPATLVRQGWGRIIRVPVSLRWGIGEPEPESGKFRPPPLPPT